MSVCLFDCAVEGKLLELSAPKSAGPLHALTLRSNVLTFVMGIAGMWSNVSVHVDTTAHFFYVLAEYFYDYQVAAIKCNKNIRPGWVCM